MSSFVVGLCFVVMLLLPAFIGASVITGASDV